MDAASNDVRAAHGAHDASLRRKSNARAMRRSSSYGVPSSAATDTINEDSIDTPFFNQLNGTPQRPTMVVDNVNPRIWRSRPSHNRRASQPVNNSMLRQRIRANSLIMPQQSNMTMYDESEGNGENTSSSSSSSSDDNDEARVATRKLVRHQQDSLDYLDLSISMPYALIALRDHLLAYATQLEERMRALYHFPPSECDQGSATSSEPQQTTSSMPVVFYSHLEALKEELRALINALPSASNPIQLKGANAGVVLEAGRQTLAEDWERLSKSLHTTLAMRPDFPLSLTKSAHARAKAFLANELPSLPAIPPALSDLSLARMWAPLAGALPMSHGGTNVLFSVQKRFEALQEAVRAMTLRDLFLSAKTTEREQRGDTQGANDENAILNKTRARSGSFAVSQQALVKQFESILDSVKARSEVVRVAGHARASSMVKAAREAEERVYAKAVELARNGQLLLRYEHLPELWQNNEHILSGYRFIPKDQWHNLLKSTFEIHNETGNIMTHLLGALLVTPLFWPSKDRFDEQTTPMDRMVQTIYLVAALKCLLLSVAWHVMAGCSDACLFERFACVDYTGIAWLVAASVWTLVYNAFYCQPKLAMIYSLSTLLVGLIGAIVPWQAWFNERRNKPIRIGVFLAMCFTGLAPFTHAILSHGVYKTVGFFGAIVPSLVAYVFGLVFYAFQMPERFFPGRFDVVGQAHQIWHISIVVAIVLHYRATFYWHENRFNFSCAASLPETGSTSLLTVNPLALDLNLADEMVHGWRIVAGRIGDGLVGRIWDRCVDGIMSTF